MMQIADILTANFPALMSALMVTLRLTVVSLFFATIIGVIFGLFKVSGNRILKFVADIYIDIIRGTPLMVQTMIIYYGVGQVLRPMGFMWANFGGSFAAAAVTLSLNAGAYMAEIIRGGIEAVDKGQMEAARCLGLTGSQAMFKVVLPQAVRNILPALGNEFINMIKQVSLASVFFINELTTSYKTVLAATYIPIESILIAGMIYLLVTTVLSQVVNVMEWRMRLAEG